MAVKAKILWNNKAGSCWNTEIQRCDCEKANQIITLDCQQIRTPQWLPFQFLNGDQQMEKSWREQVCFLCPLNNFLLMPFCLSVAYSSVYPKMIRAFNQAGAQRNNRRSCIFWLIQTPVALPHTLLIYYWLTQPFSLSPVKPNGS